MMIITYATNVFFEITSFNPLSFVWLVFFLFTFSRHYHVCALVKVQLERSECVLRAFVSLQKKQNYTRETNGQHAMNNSVNKSHKTVANSTTLALFSILKTGFTPWTPEQWALKPKPNAQILPSFNAQSHAHTHIEIDFTYWCYF